MLVFYKLNSAIERGTKPDALESKPCHWTSTLKAAIVNARRAWKYAQTRCMTFLKCMTSVSLESTVSTNRRSGCVAHCAREVVKEPLPLSVGGMTRRGSRTVRRQ